MNAEDAEEEDGLPVELRGKYREFAALMDHYEESKHLRNQRRMAKAMAEDNPPYSCVSVIALLIFMALAGYFLYAPQWGRENQELQRQAANYYYDPHGLCQHQSANRMTNDYRCAEALAIIKRDPWAAGEWPHLCRKE